MAQYVMGIDGGGTKTIGVLMEDSGKVLARTVGESSNFQVVGGEKLGQVIKRIFDDLRKAAGVTVQSIDHLFAGLAGAGRPADRSAISEVLTTLRLAESYTVDSDAAAALGGAFAGGPGVILISGTGSICFGKDETGNLVRCSGWGYLLGDEGSGYFIGQQAIIAALKDLDGRGEQTSLRKVIEKKYDLASIDLIISQIYSGKIDRTEIAGIAPLVFEQAEIGDAVAQNIITTAGRELGKVVAAVAKKLGKQNDAVSVALVGSVFKQRDKLLPFVREEALRVAAKVDFIDPLFEPAVGAAILALQKLGVAVGKEILDQIKASAPVE